MDIVFDNLIFSLQSRGGGSIYWAEIISGISALKDINAHYVTSPIRDNISHTDYSWNGDTIKLERHPSISRFAPPRYSFRGSHIFHSSYYRYSRDPNAINICTVHDFTNELFAKGIRRALHHTMKTSAIRHAKAVICISENTKKDFLHYYPAINEQHVFVVYNGVSPVYHPLPANEIARSMNEDYNLTPLAYALFVGHRTSYKNFGLAVRAVASIPHLVLAIVGNPLDHNEQRMLDALLGNRYRVFEKVSNKGLNSLYNGAFCLLYPSSYEGFGIPVIEAMRAGCPVICSLNSSLKEVGGDAALFMDNLSLENCVERLRDLKGAELREISKERGFQWSDRFSWSRTIEETMRVYRTVYES